MELLIIAGLLAATLWMVASFAAEHASAGHTNALADETSPYLRQHAHNPVDWRPWGEPAFEAAKQEDKPIFLSLGYSTCHWCHVMAHESFEDEEVAALLNEHFVPVKVDREELPDVDSQYMLATQAFYMLARQPRGGGWPNSVWLMPDGRPFYAGTYFPKPQFMHLLNQLADLWRNHRDQVLANAEAITDLMQRMSTLDAEAGDVDRELIDRAVQAVFDRYDGVHGGFGTAPKFPPHGSLALLIHACQRNEDPSLRNVITGTLDAMAMGGVYDQVGGGFHRYATDARWFLPHFEKMLYDNAQLLRAYAEGYGLTGNETYRRVVDEIHQWLTREMTDAAGGLHSAIDADSEGEEGKFYVWHVEEVRAVLGDDAALFIELYNLEPAGNWTEEATGHRPGTNIPHLTESLAAHAERLDMPLDELRAELDAMRRKLRERRDQRIWPHIDDKVLTAWNGLAIAGLAHASRQLAEPAYLETAKRVADFLLETMRDGQGRLLRVYRGGRASQPAYLDDYAYLIDGLLELHEATDDSRWLEAAKDLADRMVEQFEDRAAGAFYFTGDRHDERILRSKNPMAGGNTPSPNGVAARVLLELGRRTGESSYTVSGYRTIQAFAALMQQQPFAVEELIVAASVYLDDEALRQQVAEAGPEPAGRPASAAGAEPDAMAESPDDGPVTVYAYRSHEAVRPGETVKVLLDVWVDEPYHIYAPDPGAEGLLPTAVTLLDTAAASVGDVVYPPAEPIDEDVSGRQINGYRGRLPIAVPIAVAADAKPGERTLTLQLQTQACDDRHCLAPERHRLELTLRVGDERRPLESHRPLFEQADADPQF